MATDPQAVAAVMEVLECVIEDCAAGVFCNTHHCYADEEHATLDLCDKAVAVVEAVTPTIAARALEDAARALPGFPGIATHGDAARWLRDRAAEIRNQPKETP